MTNGGEESVNDNGNIENTTTTTLSSDSIQLNSNSSGDMNNFGTNHLLQSDNTSAGQSSTVASQGTQQPPQTMAHATSTTPTATASTQQTFQQFQPQQQYAQQYPTAYPSFPVVGQPAPMAYLQTHNGYPPHMLQQPPYVPPAALPQVSMGSTGPRGYPSQNSTSSTAPTLNDPLNDVKSWTEHVSDVDKRVYWHNKVTKTSTYDKPECLKCPEERSIPPCRWKEYSKDGKIYYSDGKESSWTMPEEFREWKSRVDAAVERRKKALESAKSSSSTPKAKPKAKNEPVKNFPVDSTERKQESNELDEGMNVTEATADEQTPEVVTYASEKEAIQAFKQLLADNKVTPVMKFKEAQDLCSRDHRWNACKTTGARKQAYSEYQTQRLKIEREEKRLEARKKRDMFFELLAETTAIDSRTRWRDAQVLLQESRRYKQIESDREREDYFTEFVVELAKKEKEDLLELKKMVKASFVAVLDDMFAAGKIQRNAIWADVRDDILGKLDSKFNTLDDSDRRHMFQDYMIELEKKLREEEKNAQEEWKKNLIAFQAEFRDYLLTLAAGGGIAANTKWREVKPSLASHPTYTSLLSFISEKEPKRDEKDKSEVSSSAEGGPRDVFDEVMEDIVKRDREDKKVLLKVFEDGLEMKNKESGSYDIVVDEVTHKSNIVETKSQIEKFLKSEDVDEGHKLYKIKSQLAEVLSQRLGTFEKIFESVKEERIEEEEIRLEKERKFEDRYLDLLDDYYYRSDHVGIKWEEAKRELCRRSAYLDLSREKRKSLFLDHMKELADELAKKAPASSLLLNKGKSLGVVDDHEEGEISGGSDENVNERIESHSEKESSNSKRKRSASPSRSHSRERSTSASRLSSKDREDFNDNYESKGKSKHSHSDKSSKRKRRDSKSDGWDSVDEDGEGSGKERKSKKSKKEKKEKKSHKHKVSNMTLIFLHICL